MFVEGKRRDAKGRETLVRYCLRPALSAERLSILRDGSIALRCKYSIRGKTHSLRGAEIGREAIRDRAALGAHRLAWTTCHQGLGNQLIEPLPANSNAGEGAVRRRDRLGGALRYCYRDAA